MKNKLLFFFVIAMCNYAVLAQSGDFDCIEDTAFQTKFIVGSSKYVVNIPRATGILSQYAESGCLDAQLKLAEVYSSDKYDTFDAEKACYYAKMAMNSGSEEGKQLLLKFYKEQIGCSFGEDEISALMTCDEKTDLAYKLFRGTDVIVAKENEAFMMLTKYADDGCVEAQYIVGKYAKKGFRGDKIQIDYDKAFKYLSMAANQGHPRAHAHLGQLYERGYGCDLNYDKALELFTTAYELGDGMGAYCIGYDYLRGMGNVEQSYDKAIAWFEKSDYQMATHWLAILNYFGFGMPVDKEKAIELLVNNEGIYNSPRLLEHFEAHKNDPDTILGDFKEMDVEAETEKVNAIFTARSEADSEERNGKISIRKISSKWKGKLVELDFAGERIVREFPITLDIKGGKNKKSDNKKGDNKKGGKNKRGNNTVNYAIHINEANYEGEAILVDGNLYFNDLVITIPKLYKDNLEVDLHLKILSTDLERKRFNNIEYLTAYVESKELNWNEKGTPLLLVLANTRVVTDNDVVISEEIIEELLNAQGENFITLYPNPFESDLLIQYDLAKESYTNVEIYSLYGGFYKKIISNELQPGGEKLYFFNGNTLDKGYYVVKVSVDGLTHTKMIIKE